MPGEIEFKEYGFGAIEIIPEGVYIVLVVLLGVCLPFFFWRKGLRDGMRYSMRVLLVEWVFLIMCTGVIFRESGEYSRINLIPLSSYFDIAENSYLMEVTAINILNVVMFIPVGLFMGLGFKKISWKNVLLASMGISLSIELLQFSFKRGLCEVDDVIHNVLGCLMGYVAYVAFRNIWKNVV